MAKGKDKASWDANATRVFIELCVKQVNKGERRNSKLSKPAWQNIASDFTEMTGRTYEKSQFKNKFDALRKEWQSWDRLLQETGIGWDNEKKTVIADNDWWDRKIAAIPAYEKFIYQGLQFQDELTRLFSIVAATGPDGWAPSSQTLPTEGIDCDQQEGSGDSDEILRSPTGLSGDFNSFTFNSGGSGHMTDRGKGRSSAENTSSQFRSSSSLGVKRKSCAMKKKGPALAKIAEALARIADSTDLETQRANARAEEARAERLAAEEQRLAAEAQAYEMSISGVLSHINTVQEILYDQDFYTRCVHLLRSDPSTREVYVSLKNMRDRLLMWLRYEDNTGMEEELTVISNHQKRRTERLKKVVTCVGAYASLYLCKEPARNNEFTGAAWVQDVLRGFSDRCYEMFRMELRVFHALCFELEQHGLRPTTNMGIHEMVAIFLNTVGHDVGVRIQKERFVRSGETIHRAFHSVLQACCGLAMSNIKPQDPTFQHVHCKISQSNRYWPFFQDAIGAIDGTHIPCEVSAAEKVKYIGRKGFASQNVMAVCDWDMCFTFVLAGWEGSAHDARVFDHAINTPSMNFPHPPDGKYYLVDSGYPTPMGYLGPYRCERYHLPDFHRSSGLQNNNEKFNYLHSSLRSTIERTFGVWKNKFQILRKMRSYSFPTQVKIVCATMAVHNFIRRSSISDPDFQYHDNGGSFDDDADDDVQPLSILSLIPSSSDMGFVRDTIRDQIIRYTQDA